MPSSEGAIADGLAAAPSVKSAGRALEILEFFADCRQPSTLSEVAQALGYPLSSTSALLTTLRDLGYLAHDPENRTFMPTLRTALLGIWVNNLFLNDGNILKMMYRLRDRTRDTVVLGAQSGLHVQYIHVVRSLVRRSSPYVMVGRLRPLLRSAVGHAILSLKPDEEILAITRRINAAERDPANWVRPSELMKWIARCRREGYGYTEGLTTPGSGIVAVLLAAPAHQPPIALGIGAPIARLRKQKQTYLAALRSVVEVHRRYMERNTGSL